MLSQQSWAGSPIEAGQRKMGLIAFLFFMLGALHIYVEIQKQKDWFCSEGIRLVRYSLAAATFAGILELLVW